MRHRAFVVSGLIVVLAGCPDRKSPERLARAAVAKFEVFANQMCACKDKACADKVQEDMTKWATEMAADSSVAKTSKPDEETMKKMTDLGMRYAECMTKVMEPAMAALPVRDDIPLASTTRDADTLLREARSWGRTKQPEHFVTDVQLDYVDARGMLDDQHGKVDVTFGRALKKADDTTRKIGAPVEKPTVVEDCFQLTWTASQGWSRTTYGCNDARDVANRCSVAATWKKAIERGAPPAGLAKIAMNTMSAHHMWSFRVQDEPRGIDIFETFADDCPLAVEK